MAAPSKTTLSPRQLEVLRLLASGHTKKDIARSLGLILSTVEQHTGRIREFLEAKNTTHAVALAFEQGLLVCSGANLDYDAIGGKVAVLLRQEHLRAIEARGEA